MKNILVSLALLLFLAGCAAPQPTQQELAAANYGPYPGDYEHLVKNYMQYVLKDPDSARYRFLNAPRQGYDNFGGRQFGYVVCAYVNAKNSYGGYTGDHPYYFMINSGRILHATGDGKVFESDTPRLCSPFV